MGLIVDLEVYSRQKQATIAWYYNQGKEDQDYTIATLSPATMLPCITISCWLGEEIGFNEKLIQKIKTLIMFYGYTEIISTPKNWPLELIQYLEI